MKPSQVFGIIVRTFGLLLTVYSMWYLAYGIATTLGLPEDAPGYEESYYLSGLVCFFLGLYCLRGAPLIVRFSYPSVEDSDREEVPK
jgi:hypothetical protein